MFEGLSAGFETLRHTQNETEKKNKKQNKPACSRFRQCLERLYIDFVAYTKIYMWALIQEQPLLSFFHLQMTHIDMKTLLIKPNIMENLFCINELKLLFEQRLQSAFK